MADLKKLQKELAELQAAEDNSGMANAAPGNNAPTTPEARARRAEETKAAIDALKERRRGEVVEKAEGE
jgi:hypothetical protein